MLYPTWAGAAGTQGVLEAAVEPLDQTIALWVVGGGLHVLDVEHAAEGGPECRRELAAPVRGDGSRHTKAGNPASEKSVGAVGGGGGAQRDRLSPARGPINHSEQICEPL